MHESNIKEHKSYPYSNVHIPSAVDNTNVDAIYIQITELKVLVNAESIENVLETFLSDVEHKDNTNSNIGRYSLSNGVRYYDTHSFIPYGYLFAHGIINNLIYAWNIGIECSEYTLISYAVQVY